MFLPYKIVQNYTENPMIVTLHASINNKFNLSCPKSIMATWMIAANLSFFTFLAIVLVFGADILDIVHLSLAGHVHLSHNLLPIN